MESLAKISEKCRFDSQINKNVDLSRLFDNDCDNIRPEILFFSRFGVVPNWITLEKINCEKANKWFLETYGNETKDRNYIKRSNRQNKINIDDIYYFIFDDLLVYMDTGRSVAKLFYKKTSSEDVEKFVDKIQKFRKTERHCVKPEIQLLVSSHGGLRTVSMEIAKPKFALENNYNDDFLPVHNTILQRLAKKNDKGLVLLHGKPGTGKTSYIRYLVSRVKKNVIFLPPNMAGSITEPGLMEVLIENPNSILVIEDAENIIIDRNRNNFSPVSSLLNLADGLLSDCLNIQIICSFNTDLSRVDNALMRKGRLIAKYEFGDLEIHKAQALSDKLGYSAVITSPMMLTSIYNQGETEYSQAAQARTIGFKSA